MVLLTRRPIHFPILPSQSIHASCEYILAAWEIQFLPSDTGKANTVLTRKVNLERTWHHIFLFFCFVSFVSSQFLFSTHYLCHY